MVRRGKSISARARLARGWSLGLYIAGIAAIGSGLLVAGIVAAATGTAAGLTVAAIIGGAGAATGALGLWESRRFGRRAERLEGAVSEQRLYALAEKNGGVLGAADVAKDLTVTRAEAEELLDHLVDEVRVSMQVTDEGQIQYVFREIAERQRPRIRVMQAAEEVPVEVEESSGDRARN